MARKLTTLIFTLLLSLTPALSNAASQYSAAVTINGQGVTYFEIEQRALMLEALGTIGDVRTQAREDLIDDRLRQQAGRALGLTVTDLEVQAGVEEFAKRVNMTSKQFFDYLAENKVERETYLDFVKSGLIWRKVIQQKYQNKAFITEAELDTAMALGTVSFGASVLLSEIVLPYDADTKAETLDLASELSRTIHGTTEFEEAAITFSAAPSRESGGKLDWAPVSALPETIGNMLLAMGAGRITPPIPLPGAYAIFYIRGIRDNRSAATRTLAYDYATLLLPGGRSPATLATASQLAGSIDTCNDLLAKSTAYPEEYYQRQVVATGKVPARIAGELAKLDANEDSTVLTSGENNEFLEFLMLCGRTNEITEGNRAEVRQAMFAQRMEAFGEGYLQELKGDAIILEK